MVHVASVGTEDVAYFDGSWQPSMHHVASETTSMRTRAATKRRMARHYHSQHFGGECATRLSGLTPCDVELDFAAR